MNEKKVENQIALRKIEEKFASEHEGRVNLSEINQWSLVEYYHWLQQEDK